MKNKNGNMYISSFKDFQLEKERLLIKKELIEARLNLSYMRIRNIFSISNSLISLAKEFVFPKVSNILGWLLKKVEN